MGQQYPLYQNNHLKTNIFPHPDRNCVAIVIARKCLPAGRQGTTEAISQGCENKGDCHACVPKLYSGSASLIKHSGVQARSLRSLAMTKWDYDTASLNKGWGTRSYFLGSLCIFIIFLLSRIILVS
jgi:ferredoxin